MDRGRRLFRKRNCDYGSSCRRARLLEKAPSGIAGQELPTVVVKGDHFHNVDLTLLSVEEYELPVNLGLRRMPLCQMPSRIGEQVIVATPEGVARSYVMSLLAPGIPAKFETVIQYVPASGGSGSGVFDANKKCLLGIISRIIRGDQGKRENGGTVNEARYMAKYFVPASTIADFVQGRS